MPALVAIRHQPNLRAFYQHLRARVLRPYEERGKPIHVDEGSRLNSQLQLILANQPGP